ncbi:MAG: 16S rRNA (guanine(966)-N(2))-methyltransferase RsmD [Nitrospirae bacterium]|nr:16S rRNA (guanine(966)-N(2))-methyltransferase RsmD [Nitrospirota bacterium]
MRISGGESRGRRLMGPRHGGVRPTSDKVREALFSILAARVEGSVFLELFAGTGAVGIEALSRGAARAVFVDASSKSTRLIRENLNALGYRDRAAVVAKDALQFMKKDAAGLGPFGLAFVDPPYHEEVGDKAMDALGSDEAAGVLTDGAVVVYEHFKKHAAPESFGRLARLREYVYGDTVLTLYASG